ETGSMRSVQLHATLLALALLVLGIGSIAWQVLVQDIPLTETETDPVWIVDASIEFDARENLPVKVQMFVPPGDDFATLNESLVAHKYGVNVQKVGGNRQVTWSTRRAEGRQALYYRLALTRRITAEESPS